MKKAVEQAESPPKARAGKPGFKPTAQQRTQVELLVGFGIPEVEIVRLVLNPYSRKPIDHKTLRKHFMAELESGRARAKAKVIGGLYKNATTPTDQYPGGIPTAQIFWLKTQGGPSWRERDPMESPSREFVDGLTLIEQARVLGFYLNSVQRAREGKPIDPSVAIPRPALKPPTS